MQSEITISESENYRLNVDYYGADFPVDLLVKRMEQGDFIIPGFQREYVWKEMEASRFIESLLIGLPTAALFLAKDKFSNQYLVIDGQQRLKTLQYFYAGEFPEGKPFKLKGVTPALNGLTYSTLPPSERRALDNSIIHCIIISDNYDPSGMFHLFERLNTTGTPLNAQEVRNAIYHGPFSEALQELSKEQIWRLIYGKPGNRAEEQELILRFVALHFDFANYRGNLTDFLNHFMLTNRQLDLISKSEMRTTFLKSLDFLNDCIGSRVFVHNKSFSRVLFESIMLLAAKKIGDRLDCKEFKKFYESLIVDDEFWSMSQHATTSRKNLDSRLAYIENLYETARK
jgi:hypothetical protein